MQPYSCLTTVIVYIPGRSCSKHGHVMTLGSNIIYTERANSQQSMVLQQRKGTKGIKWHVGACAMVNTEEK